MNSRRPLRLLLRKAAALALSLSMVQPQGAVLLWAAPSAIPILLEEVQAGADQVRLRLTQPVQVNAFTTASPTQRLVLELPGVQLGLAENSFEGRGRYLRGVRAGQFAASPNPIARVVLDLNGPAGYKASWSGSELFVTLGAPSSQAAPPAPAVAEKPAAPASPPPAPPAPVKPPASAASPAKATSPAPKAAAPDPAEQAGSMSTDFTGELGAMVEKASRESARPAAAVPPARRLRRDVLASLPRDPVTLDFDNAEVGDILKLLASKANLNIIYGSDVAGTLSLHLADVPYQEAFNIVLSMKGLVATQVGDNTVRVMTPAALTKARQDAVGITRVFHLSYRKASEAKLALDSTRAAEKRQGSAVADDTNNDVIVTETPEGLSAVERLLGELDVRPQQVLIEAKLIEVNLNKDLNLGIQWDYLGIDRARHFGQAGTDVIGAVPTAQGDINLANRPLDQNSLRAIASGASPVGATARGSGVFLPADKVFGAFTFGRITNNYFLTATLTAAASQGKIKVLSDPKIATINGKQATINITTQIPYVTSTVSSTGVATQTVSYTTTGILLAVTPTINADGRITLKVTPTVSKPSAIAAAAGGTGAVAVDSRQADTNVLVKDGETIVIGGLITDSVTNSEAKVPLLGDIPILGWLFKKKTILRSRVELLIFVTTKIIPD